MRELEYPFDGEQILKKSKKLKRALLEERSGKTDRGSGRFHHPRYHTDSGTVFITAGNPSHILRVRIRAVLAGCDV